MEKAPYKQLEQSTQDAIRKLSPEDLAKCAEELLAFGTPEATALGTLTRGIWHYSKGDYNKALPFHQEALDLYTELDDKPALLERSRILETYWLEGIRE